MMRMWVCVVIGVMPLLSACRTEPVVPVSELPTAHLVATTSSLKHTKLTAHLDAPIEKDTNLLWCASFQIAWNQLMAQVGGAVELSDKPAIADALNRQDVTAASLDDRDYIALAGRADRTAAALRKQLTRKFGPTANTPLLDGLSCPADALLFYAYMQKHMPFPRAFDELDPVVFRPDPSDMSPPKYEAFGVDQFMPSYEKLREMAKQVRIIHHEFLPARNEQEERFPRQQYVVELLTTAEDYRLVLACIEPKPTLGKTIDAVVDRCREPNTLVLDVDEDLLKQAMGTQDRPALEAMLKRMSQVSHLQFIETLQIPVIDIDVTGWFGDLLGQTLLNAGSPWRGQPIGDAAQRLRFRLDRHGAAVESEAMGHIFAGAPRAFMFNRPFLLLILQEPTQKPVLAMWIAHEELLVRAAEHETQP